MPIFTLTSITESEANPVATKPQWSPFLHPNRAGVTEKPAATPASYVGPGNLNSGSHARQALSSQSQSPPFPQSFLIQNLDDGAEKKNLGLIRVLCCYSTSVSKAQHLF